MLFAKEPKLDQQTTGNAQRNNTDIGNTLHKDMGYTSEEY